jgi:hypothetical protein
MTAKEKANKLYEAYLEVGMGDGWAKQCALIAVDEILYILGNMYFLGQSAIFSSKYWTEVKAELNKL